MPENKVAKESLYKVGQIAENVLERLGLGQAGYTSKKDNVRRAPLPSTLYQVSENRFFFKAKMKVSYQLTLSI